MKRPKSPSLPSPSTPPPPHLRRSPPKRITSVSAKRRNILQNPQPEKIKWKPLNIPKSELYLPLTLPTGQTFRWRETGPLQYTGPIGPHLVSLKQLDEFDGGVGYFCHFTADEDKARSDLFEFLNMGVSLNSIWGEFRAADSRFAELAVHLEGARVLRQEPLECLIQFICSSNNNIGRITKMVDYISAKGRLLGSVGGFDFFEFPSLEKLVMLSEAELREAGFGYRWSLVLDLSCDGCLHWLYAFMDVLLMVALMSYWCGFVNDLSYE